MPSNFQKVSKEASPKRPQATNKNLLSVSLCYSTTTMQLRPRFISLLCAIVFALAIKQGSTQAPVTCSYPLMGGGFYNITLTSADSGTLVKIIKVDENGNALYKASYSDAVIYYDGHMTSLVTREAFSLTFQSHFGCYRNCMSTSLSRDNPPLLQTFKYNSCGGESYCN